MSFQRDDVLRFFKKMLELRACDNRLASLKYKDLVMNGFHPYIGDSIRNRCIGKVGAKSESPVTNARNAVGYLDTGKVDAYGERQVSNVRNAVGNRDTSQPRKFKCPVRFQYLIARGIARLQTERVVEPLTYGIRPRGQCGCEQQRGNDNLEERLQGGCVQSSIHDRYPARPVEIGTAIISGSS